MREFTHPVRLDPWPPEGVVFALRADQEARRRLAGRLGVDALDRFEAQGTIERAGRMFLLEAHLCVDVQRRCVVTLEPFAERLDTDVRLELVPGLDAEDELLDPERPDSVPIDGSHVDLGEVLAEELALMLDPHPRAPGASLDALDAPPDPAEAPPDDWRARLARHRQALAG